MQDNNTSIDSKLSPEAFAVLEIIATKSLIPSFFNRNIINDILSGVYHMYLNGEGKIPDRIASLPYGYDSRGITRKRLERFFDYDQILDSLSSYHDSPVKKRYGYSQPNILLFSKVLPKVRSIEYTIDTNKAKEWLDKTTILSPKELAVLSLAVKYNIESVSRKEAAKKFREVKPMFYFDNLFEEIKRVSGDQKIFVLDRPKAKVGFIYYVFDVEKVSEFYQKVKQSYNRR